MSNKDEAHRAKDVAEDYMKKAEFTTARRVAAKAQKMDASLESTVSRMIMVCDVHCAALEKSGDETDWYKILQVEQNADDNAIKKQYRKLALHLHPDKNTLPGAESAFKIIGEAQRVLLDKDKRRLHDMRRKPNKRPAPAPSFQPQRAPGPFFQPQRAPATASYTQPVFQTNVNATCKQKPTEFGGKQYTAFQATFQGPPDQSYFAFSQNSKVPTQEAGKAAEKQPESSANIFSSKEGSKAKSSTPSAENSNGKRKRKKEVESSDSSCSDGNIECQEVPAGGQDSGSTGVQHSRRSVRSKEKISYKENKSDDDNQEQNAESAKEPDFGKSHMFAETLPNGRNRTKNRKVDQVGTSGDSGACKAAKDSSSGSDSEAEIFKCPDVDFSNFEKSLEEKCFKAGQTWAMYDDMDQMPRFYCIIRKVRRKPKFLVNTKWLEAKPDDEIGKHWVDKKLPISVGKFELGDNQTTDKIPSFSHLIHCREGRTNDTFRIYPRKGEVWALFKNWDINWLAGHQRSSNEYEYEFVEILSEHVEGFAIEVAFLRKVQGFKSVFCRIAPGGGSNISQILPHELLRFSHNIPSTKLTGKEGNGVPVDSYELDTAALPPQKIEEKKAARTLREAAKSSQVHHRSPPSLEPDCIVIPRYEFHDFSAERLEGKFESGQVWSLNSKEDGLPKCYAKIQKIVWRPIFKLQISRLEPESLPENVTEWRDKKMPVTCGNFTLEEGRDETLTQVTVFSHQIKAQPHFGRNKYTVLPKTGEIWALYKNWTCTMKIASLKRCEYEVVEVLNDSDSHIEVMMMERVQGFISVYKEKIEAGIDVRKKIPWCELLRFSHYVPAFRLTGERDGGLRGFVELDPTALPLNSRRS